MNVSLEEVRPFADALLEALHERFGNGSLTLHFHDGLLVRIETGRVYRPIAKKPDRGVDTEA